MFELSTLFFLQMAAILAAYKMLWPLFKRLRQVQVVAIMVAGFLLGPSFFGLIWPAAHAWLFPTKLMLGGSEVAHPSLTLIYVVGQLGLVLYMFLVGTAFRVDIFRQHFRQAAGTSIVGVGVPLILGGLLGWLMVSGGSGMFAGKVTPWQGGLFLAAAVAVTAFPVLAWIVYDSGLQNTRIGTMTLACAAADDTCAWILLATVVATTKGSMFGVVVAVGGGLIYAVILLTLGRKGLDRLGTWAKLRSSRTGTNLSTGTLTATLLFLLVGAWYTEYIGLHAVFGAFTLGVVMPRGEVVDKLRERLEPITAYLLLPAFFIYSGLSTRLSLILAPSVLAMALLVLFVAFASKFGAVGLAARLQGMSWHESGSIGALANARGVMELVLLNVGLSAGLIGAELFTMLTIMTIVTTFAATPLHRFFERSARRNGMVYGPSGMAPTISAADAEMMPGIEKVRS